MTLLKIDVLELERRQRAVAGAGQDRERDQGAVARFNIGGGGHRGEDVSDLLQGRHRRGAAGLCDPRIVGRQVEIVGVGIGQFRAVAGLPMEPMEERPKMTQGRIEGSLCEPLPRTLS